MSRYEYGQEEIDRLNQKVVDKDQEITLLRKRLDDLESKNNDLFQKQKEAQYALNEYQKQLEEQGQKKKIEDPTVVLKSSYDSLLKEYEAILAFSEDLKKKYSIKEELLKELKQKSSEILIENNSLKEKIDNQSREIIDLNANCRQLENSLDEERSKQEHFEQIELDYNKLVDENNSLLLENRNLSDDKKILNDRIIDLQNQLDLERARGEQKTVIQSTVDTVRPPVTNIYSEENDKLKRQIERYEAEIKQYQEDAKLVVEWVDREVFIYLY